MANYIPKIEYTHPVDGATTITFTLPPENDHLGEKTKMIGKQTKSSSGNTQTQFNYHEKTFKVQLVFLTLTQITALRKMFNDHSGKGGEFKYYQSSDEVDFDTVKLSSLQFQPKRIVRSGADFIYDLTLNMRFVL